MKFYLKDAFTFLKIGRIQAIGEGEKRQNQSFETSGL
jgi:hypothetical protein